MTPWAPLALQDLCPSTSASFSFTLLNQWVAWRCRPLTAASGEPHPLCPAVVGTPGYKLLVRSFTPLTSALRCRETGCPAAPAGSSHTCWEQDLWDLKGSHQVGDGSVPAQDKHPCIIRLCHLQRHTASRKGNTSSSNSKTPWLCIQAAGPTPRRMKGYETI